MSSRYIARRYGTEVGGSRPGSRASMAAIDSRPPSRGPLTSRPPSRGASISRGASPTPSYYTNASPSGRSSPVQPPMSRGMTPAPRGITPAPRGITPAPRGMTPGTPGSGISEYYPRRSVSPLRTSYTDLLCTASRRLRERSIPPPAILPDRIEPLRPPPPTGRPPPAPPRVVASDFYRGKVKSIYEREPLFADFCRTMPQRYGNVNIYNTGTLDTLKNDFKTMVEDKWRRKELKDPSVEMNFGAKAYAWRDLAVKPRERESKRIFREQEARPRGSTPVGMPRVYVYHRSTMSPAPQ